MLTATKLPFAANTSMQKALLRNLNFAKVVLGFFSTVVVYLALKLVAVAEVNNDMDVESYRGLL